ncbi:MAG: hypothetical protein Q9227_003150 [Pyrenula ochraceoflavens]
MIDAVAKVYCVEHVEEDGLKADEAVPARATDAGEVGFKAAEGCLRVEHAHQLVVDGECDCMGAGGVWDAASGQADDGPDELGTEVVEVEGRNRQIERRLPEGLRSEVGGFGSVEEMIAADEEWRVLLKDEMKSGNETVLLCAENAGGENEDVCRVVER